MKLFLLVYVVIGSVLGLAAAVYNYFDGRTTKYAIDRLKSPRLASLYLTVTFVLMGIIWPVPVIKIVITTVRMVRKNDN